MSISQDLFRRVMGYFPTGVTVVTAVEPDGQLRGLTVNALCSVSIDPTLLLICIDHRSDSFNAVQQGKAFAVNFLRADQQEISTLFASKGVEKFKDLSYRLGDLGMPLLAGTMAWAECRVIAEYPGGDHTIFLAEVESAHIEGGSPLLFFRGNYATWPASGTGPG